MWGWLTGENPTTTGTTETGFYPELPTPKTEPEFQQVFEDKVKLLTTLSQDPKWVQIDYVDTDGKTDIKLYDMSIPDSAVSFVKTETTLNIAAKTLFRLVQSKLLATLKQFDKDLAAIKVVKEISSNLQILRTIYTAPFPVSDREFVVLRGGQTEDGTFVSVNTSINYGNLIDLPSTVRGVCSVAGWIIRSIDENHSHCIRVAQVDPKGWIPPLVVNLFKHKAAEGVYDIKKLIESNTLILE